MKIAKALSSKRVFSGVVQTFLRVAAACRATLTSRISLRGERGQSLIEFALLIPIILVIILLIRDAGIALDRKEVLQHAIREGARHGATGADPISIQDYTADQAQDILVSSDVSVCYVDMDGNGDAGNVGDNVRVSASYDHELAIASFELLGGSPLTIGMTPSADMRLEASVAGGAVCPP